MTFFKNIFWDKFYEINKFHFVFVEISLLGMGFRRVIKRYGTNWSAVSNWPE